MLNAGVAPMFSHWLHFFLSNHNACAQLFNVLNPSHCFPQNLPQTSVLRTACKKVYETNSSIKTIFK